MVETSALLNPKRHLSPIFPSSPPSSIPTPRGNYTESLFLSRSLTSSYFIPQTYLFDLPFSRIFESTSDARPGKRLLLLLHVIKTTGSVATGCSPGPVAVAPLREGLANNVFTVLVDFAFAKVFDQIVNVAHDALNLKATQGNSRRIFIGDLSTHNLCHRGWVKMGRFAAVDPQALKNGIN